MKKLLSIILAIVLTMALFTSCAEPAEALTSVYLNLGEKYLTDLNYEEAIVYFNKVIEVEPKNARAYLGSAEAYEAMGDIDSAISILANALSEFSDDVDVQIEFLERLIELEPANAEWYLNLAQIYINNGDTDTAVEILQNGLEGAEDIADITDLLEQLIPTEPEEEIPEITAEDIGAAINEASLFAWNWFWDNQHTDKNDTILGPYGRGYYTYERVSEEGITTLDDVRALTQQYFTADAAEELINVKKWIEQDGVLYVSGTEGLGGDFQSYNEIYVEKISDTSYNVKMYEHYSDGNLFQSEFTYSYVDGYWVFDTKLSCPREVPVYVLAEPISTEPLYDDDELTVSGTLTDRYYELNSDNYGTVYILVLDEPITRRLYSDVAGYDGEVMEIDEIQLILPYTESYIRSNLLGEHLELTGTVMYGHTGHHLTTILLDVE